MPDIITPEERCLIDGFRITNRARAIRSRRDRIAYADDAQISSATCLKVWGSTAKTIVFVQPLLEGSE